MSSLFPSQFADTHAPPRRAREPMVPATFLRGLARRLGLAGRRGAVQPADRRKGWEGDTQAMLAAGARLVARARRDDEPLSMAVFDVSDLPELETVFGAQVASEVMTQVVSRLQGLASSKGLVMRTDATVFTVLMPGCGRDRAHQAIESSMGSPCCIELDADEHEIVLVPDFKVHTMRPDSGPLAGVYADLRRDISQAQKLERRRQRYLQRERESHTRPMELGAGSPAAATAADSKAYTPALATMPMPLKR